MINRKIEWLMVNKNFLDCWINIVININGLYEKYTKK